MQATTDSFDLLTIYCVAAGRSSPAALLASTAPAADTAAHSVGLEHLTGFTVQRGSYPHPGEVAAAKRYAWAAQLRMLAAGLPPGADETAGVRVAVTVHTHLDFFIYSQPVVFQTEMSSGAWRARAAAPPIFLPHFVPTSPGVRAYPPDAINAPACTLSAILPPRRQA